MGVYRKLFPDNKTGGLAKGSVYWKLSSDRFMSSSRLFAALNARVYDASESKLLMRNLYEEERTLAI